MGLSKPTARPHRRSVPPSPRWFGAHLTGLRCGSGDWIPESGCCSVGLVATPHSVRSSNRSLTPYLRPDRAATPHLITASYASAPPRKDIADGRLNRGRKAHASTAPSLSPCRQQCVCGRSCVLSTGEGVGCGRVVCPLPSAGSAAASRSTKSCQNASSLSQTPIFIQRVPPLPW